MSPGQWQLAGPGVCAPLQSTVSDRQVAVQGTPAPVQGGPAASAPGSAGVRGRLCPPRSNCGVLAASTPDSSLIRHGVLREVLVTMRSRCCDVVLIGMIVSL